MSTVMDILAFPLSLRGLLGRESGRQSRFESASPPRRSTPPLMERRPSDPPPEPPAAVGGRMDWCAASDASTHQRIAVASLFSGRIG
jgi:hypothetical protein